MKKTVRTTVASIIIFLGMVFLIVPGPSLPLIVLGLFLLSFDHPKARKWLKIAQRKMSQSARWIDKKLLERKLAK